MIHKYVLVQRYYVGNAIQELWIFFTQFHGCDLKQYYDSGIVKFDGQLEMDLRKHLEIWNTFRVSFLCWL